MLPNPIISLFNGKVNVYMYGVMIAVGVLAALGILFLYGKKKKVDPKFLDFVFYSGIVSVLLGFLSAAALQYVLNVIKNPGKGVEFGSGMTFMGGLIGGIAVFAAIYFIFRKKLSNSMYKVLPILPCSITLAHGFGRIGCFFAGCCYGVKTDSFLGVHFPKVAGSVLPTQLFEAAFLFILFGVLSFLYLKKNSKQTLSIYLIAYAIFRFVIEFFRGDDRGAFIGPLSPSQFWSIFMLIAGVAFIFITRVSVAKAEAKELAGDQPESKPEQKDAVPEEKASDGEGDENADETPEAEDAGDDGASGE